MGKEAWVCLPQFSLQSPATQKGAKTKKQQGKKEKAHTRSWLLRPFASGCTHFLILLPLDTPQLTAQPKQKGSKEPMAAFRGGMAKLPLRLIGGLVGLGGAAYGVNESIFTGQKRNA